jgi:hypothetical protein
MVNDQLLAYIREQLSLNISKEEISASLRGTGWSDADISEAFEAIAPKSSVMSEPQPAFVEPVHKSKKIFFIIAAIVVLLLAGGGAYAYYSGTFVSLPVLASKAITNARASTSATYDTTVTVDFSEMSSATNDMAQLFSTTSNKLSVTAKGSYDGSDPKNLKSDAVISFTMGSFSAGAEIRVLNDTLYGVLTKAPTIAFFPVLSAYENKWFSVPYKSENGHVASNPVTSLSPIDPNVTDQLTTEQKDHIYKMSQDAHFIKMVKKLPLETIGGELSYHFIFDLDREGIRAYLESLKAYVNTIGKDNSALSAFDPTSFSKDLDQLRDFQGEIWIGRKDALLHKLMLTFGIQPDIAKAEQVKVNLVSVVTGWNQPVSIVTPAESIPFETFISNIMSDSMSPVPQKGKDPAVKLKK